jgi:broad specificity phosphatase PhoE
MRLIIVRHGETEENAKHIIMGHLHGKINKKGKMQIARLARILEKENIAVIYSSDLKRAVDTTKKIAEHHDAPVIYTKELREQNHGILQGKTKEDPIYVYWSKKNTKAPKSESFNEFRTRIKKFLTRLLRDRTLSDKTVLISTHGGVIRRIFSICADVPLDKVLNAQMYHWIKF